ncbi:ArfGap domain-containing protein [Cephalotus follicularis]|uniref:ArfGap domain-containing protein n=1 Tax=Cephalotus follicularis TaxID=3775 RepID=A0A1Q3CM63_CEPFO|nr:ArfGap domain-containing protein [Cephalotus follicularis]
MHMCKLASVCFYYPCLASFASSCDVFHVEINKRLKRNKRKAKGSEHERQGLRVQGAQCQTHQDIRGSSKAARKPRMCRLSKAPRWASVNLGIFICMQCSGIHRSLGVHISKVRSTTLDTWLPEQIDYMQSMGNEKSNNYWEAELPSNFDRSEIDRFVHAKYEEKRWVPKNATQPTPVFDGVICNTNTLLDGGAKTGIPNKSRKLSLEEEILTKHVTEVTPPATRFRRASLDMKGDMVIALPKGPPLTVEYKGSSEKANGAADVYSLHYVRDAKQDFPTTAASRWETFE